MRGRVADLLLQIRDRLEAEAHRAVDAAKVLDEYLIRQVIPFLRKRGVRHYEVRDHLERGVLEKALTLIGRRSILECWRGLRIAQAYHNSTWWKVQNSNWEEELDRIESAVWSKWNNRNLNVAALAGFCLGAILSFVVSSILIRGFPLLSGGEMFLFTLTLIFFWIAGGTFVGLAYRRATHRTDWLRKVAPRLRRQRRAYEKLAAAMLAMKPRTCRWGDAIHR